MVIGRDGEVTFANRAFLTINGFRRDDLLGKTVLWALARSRTPATDAGLHQRAPR